MMDCERVVITLPGEDPREIPWPPGDDPEAWELVARYMRAQSASIRHLLRAIVALEKKCHWGVPTAPLLKTRCVYACVDPDTGDPVDPRDPGDEGDRDGEGDIPDWK